MPYTKGPIALRPADCPPRQRPSVYPPEMLARYAAALAGRQKQGGDGGYP